MPRRITGPKIVLTAYADKSCGNTGSDSFIVLTESATNLTTLWINTKYIMPASAGLIGPHLAKATTPTRGGSPIAAHQPIGKTVAIDPTIFQTV